MASEPFRQSVANQKVYWTNKKGDLVNEIASFFTRLPGSRPEAVSGFAK
jgi:hypothetical protein